jgi:PBSX family phage portal protein
MNSDVNVEIIKTDGFIKQAAAERSFEYAVTAASPGEEIAPPYDPAELARYYQSNSYHQRCVQTKALVTAGLGYELSPAGEYFSDSDSSVNMLKAAGPEAEEEAEKIKRFLTNNELETGDTFIEMLIKFQTDFEVFGYAFLEVAPDNETGETLLYHMPAKNSALSFSGSGKEIVLRQNINGKIQLFSPGQFLMIKNYNPESRYYGLPEYISSLPAILLDREMMEYNISRIQNNAIPDLIVTVSGTQLSQAQKDTMKEFWKNNFKGAGNSGKTLLIESTAKDSQIQVTEIKSTYRDGAFRLAKRECRDEIIACHGVPPILLGIKTSGSIGSGKDIIEQMRTFREIIIEPRQRRLENLLNTFFTDKLGVNNTKLKLKNILITEE